MVVALQKLCLYFYLYHRAQLLVNANVSSLFKVSFIEEPIQVPMPKDHDESDGEHLIETPGCTIPNIWTEYQTVETNDCKNRCGIRAVIIDRINDDNMIEYTIIDRRMKEFFGGNSYECCSRFAYKSSTSDGLEYTECKTFQNGTQFVLEHEIITVICTGKGNSTYRHIYEDAYILVKKLQETRKSDVNSWNVLLMGMDTMSRGRAIQSMPELVKYFKKNDWLDYRAFQKAEANTYPNLLITYTGRYKGNFFAEECNNNVQECNDLFIWSKFKLSGYITAYSEDDLYHTFESILTSQPTDHYTRSFFLLGTESQGNIVCLKTRPGAFHILDYVYQFAKVYKDVKHFGSFFTSRYSHDPVHIPTLLQNQYIHLFEDLDGLGALNNTIIFFYGDHGIRYGPLKTPVASFYDERLPMLYMWFPHSFRKLYEDKYHNLQVNQHRLTTHSDLHSTFWDILKLSDNKVAIIPPRYCPRCGSLLEEKPKHRSCEDIYVSRRWCSCFVLNNVNSTDIAATLVPEILLYQISKEQNTDFQLKEILRHHWFRHENDHKDDVTYYVIAIEVTQSEKQFEAVIRQRQFEFTVIGEIDNISARDQVFDTSQC